MSADRPTSSWSTPRLGVRSLEELVELGRRGQVIDYVSPGVGTLGHLLAETFAQKAGIKLQQIMTKGASQGMMDLISGNVNVGTMTWTSALTQIRAGKVIPIAVSSNARLAEFPDLPTFKDLGYADLTAVSWFALSGPAGLPSDITARLNAAVARMLELPEVRERLDRDAVETRVMSPDEFTAIRGQRDRQVGAGRQAGDADELEPRAFRAARRCSAAHRTERRHVYLRYSDPATPACCRTFAQRAVSDVTKRSSSAGEPLPTGMN